MPARMNEHDLEQAVLSWFEELGYETAHGPDVAPDVKTPERATFADVVLVDRFRDALDRLNPDLPASALDDALHKVTRHDSPSLIRNNHTFHTRLADGVDVEYRRDDGSIGGGHVVLVDFDMPQANNWLAVNQFTVTDGKHTRRPDVVLFVNGLPLAVIELKSPTDEGDTLQAAFNQLQTYMKEVSSLFVFNEALVISDGLDARIGSLSAARERFMPWRTVTGEGLALDPDLSLEVLIKGVFDMTRFLEIVRYCTVFEDTSDKVVKKTGGYHQYHAVRLGVQETLRACAERDAPETTYDLSDVYYAKASHGRPGDRQIGVVWHTQGAGKSLTMAFYAGWIMRHPLMENPTIAVITDRNDLDQQLFDTFADCHELLRGNPKQAKNRANLRDLLQVAGGSVVFTTIQKFLPEDTGDTDPALSPRRNIVVIADEAHRSQYGFIDGFARHMRDALPNASFVGFTATPIESNDVNTRAVFGDYISVYDMQRAEEDGATVPIYYEGRLAKIQMDESERPRVDPEFEEVTEGEEIGRREALKTKWAALEHIVGTDKRIQLIAEDLVSHFEARIEAMNGKCMIVCMSRRICVEMYKAIVALRPHWHNQDDGKDGIKIVMTGTASDPPAWQPHIHSKAERERLRTRFRNPADPFRIVIVCDMWLTGFDAPCLHTMYVDKPMHSHGLMQAIARVNRVFRDKPGGLVVDYLGLAENLRQAMHTYTESGGTGQTTIDQQQAVDVMKEKYEICRDMLHGFDWSAWRDGPPAKRLKLMPSGQEHILKEKDGKADFTAAVTELSQAFALAVPHEEAIAIRDDVGFFQALRAALTKTVRTTPQSGEEMEHAIRQIVSKALAPEGVVDIYAAAGLDKPDISILSDEFLAEVRDMPQPNLAVEVLRKLLDGEIRTRRGKNVVQARSFADMLEKSLHVYQNRTVETAQVIEALIELARRMRAASARGEELGLSEDEVAFYDALETNDSTVKVLGDETLKTIAHELVASVRRSVTIDWAIKENMRAQIRLKVKKILRKYGYPPDKQDKATNTVLEQAEVLCADWAGA